MENPTYFGWAEKLNSCLDTNPNEALAKALHYHSDAKLDFNRIVERSGIDMARLEHLVFGHNFDDFNPGEARAFVEAVIGLLAEYGKPIEPEF